MHSSDRENAHFCNKMIDTYIWEKDKDSRNCSRMRQMKRKEERGRGWFGNY